jgi:hypothetical protein
MNCHQTNPMNKTTLRASLLAALALPTLGLAATAQTTPPSLSNTNAFSNPVSQLVYNVALSLGTNAPALGSETFDFNLLTMSRGLNGVENMMEFNWNCLTLATNTAGYLGADLENGAVPGVVDGIHLDLGAGKTVSQSVKIEGFAWVGRYTGTPGSEPEWEGGPGLSVIWCPTGGIGFGAEVRGAINSAHPGDIGEFVGGKINLRF